MQDQDLVNRSVHVFYEMQMLVCIPERYLTLSVGADVVIKNTLLESFAVHARQLVNFFDDAKKADDIIARDFFDGPMPDWTTTDKQDLAAMVIRVHKEIVHLTLLRIGPRRDWDFFGIVDDIASRFHLFLKHVPPNRISEPEKTGYFNMLQTYNAFKSGWLANTLQVEVKSASVAQTLNTTFRLSGATMPPRLD